MAGPPSWLVGLVAAVAALVTLRLDLPLLTSSGGLLLGGLAAFGIGAGVAALIEPRQAGRNAVIVATVIVASVFFYVALATTRPAPPGTSRGGPNVMPLP